MKTVQIHYEGRVQGVGFRWTVKEIARGFDLTGTVKNLPDGRVELLAQGDPEEVESFLEAIRTSALAAHIHTECPQDKACISGLRGFQIAP